MIFFFQCGEKGHYANMVSADALDLLTIFVTLHVSPFSVPSHSERCKWASSGLKHKSQSMLASNDLSTHNIIVLSLTFSPFLSNYVRLFYILFGVSETSIIIIIIITTINYGRELKEFN